MRVRRPDPWASPGRAALALVALPGLTAVVVATATRLGELHAATAALRSALLASR